MSGLTKATAHLGMHWMRRAICAQEKAWGATGGGLKECNTVPLSLQYGQTVHVRPQSSLHTPWTSALPGNLITSGKCRCRHNTCPQVRQQM